MTLLISAATALGDTLFWAQLAGPEQSMGPCLFPRGLHQGFALSTVSITLTLRQQIQWKTWHHHLPALCGSEWRFSFLCFKVSILHNHKSIRHLIWFPAPQELTFSFHTVYFPSELYMWHSRKEIFKHISCFSRTKMGNQFLQLVTSILDQGYKYCMDCVID